MDTPSETSILWTLIISSALARNGCLGNKISTHTIPFFHSYRKAETLNETRRLFRSHSYAYNNSKILNDFKKKKVEILQFPSI